MDRCQQCHFKSVASTAYEPLTSSVHLDSDAYQFATSARIYAYYPTRSVPHRLSCGMRLAIVKKGEAPNPTGRKTHISRTLPSAHRTRNFLTLATQEWGESDRSSTANQPCKGSKGRKPTTPNLSKRSQRITPSSKKRGEGGRGQKKEQTQPSKTPWRRFTQPPSNVAQVHEQPHWAELMHSIKMVTRTSNQPIGTSHCKQIPVCCTLAYTSRDALSNC